MADATDKMLVMLSGGVRAGTITQDRSGGIRLTYDDMWRTSPTATPVSLSMPLNQQTHDDPVRPYLLGLLPDSERVLERWAQTYHVSARNPFAMLRYVGEECAGAVQYAELERVDALLAGDGGVKLINEDELGRRIRVMRRDPAAWHIAGTGQFSLAGAQTKTALHLDPVTQQWGDPWGVVPTTHILKPAVAGFDEHDLNEHLCLQSARQLGLVTAPSEVLSFAGERVIVIERYDRVRGPDGTLTRVHQEDLCQALGTPPVIKYQNEGGPTPEQIIALLREMVTPVRNAETDVQRFVDALAFNWIIAGTDAHAKNYSVLLSGRQVRLAPLYDIASALPYDDMYAPRLRMAMRIGGEYRIEGITGRHWRRFATENGLEPDATIARIDDLAARTPSAIADAVGADAVRALDSDLPGRLAERVTAHAHRRRKALAAS